MDNVTLYMETAYNSSNSTNLTRNLNKNRIKSCVRSNFYGVVLTQQLKKEEPEHTK